MKRRTTDLMLDASFVLFIGVLAGAIYVVVTDPTRALLFWVVCAGGFVVALGREAGVTTAASIGTIAAMVGLAVHALHTFGVPVIVGIGLAAAFVVLALAYFVRAMRIAGSADYPFED